MFHHVAEKPGAAPAPAEVPAASPAKKLDNLFFIEEPKPAHATESESHERNTDSIHSGVLIEPAKSTKVFMKVKKSLF